MWVCIFVFLLYKLLNIYVILENKFVRLVVCIVAFNFFIPGKEDFAAEANTSHFLLFTFYR